MNRIARSALYYSGLLGLARTPRRQALRILVYHRFDNLTDEPSRLVWQCEHIRRHYAPISLAEVTEASAHGRKLPPNALTVTVDDGHRDFIQHALPIFSAYKIPVTLFVVSDAADAKKWLWFDQVSYLVAETQRETLDLEGKTIDLKSDRRRVANEIVERLKRTPHRERLRTLMELPNKLAVDLPAQAPAAYSLLDWAELRTLTKHQVEIGCHSKTHPILSQLEDRSALYEEISDAKLRMEEQLGTPVIHFAYPNGTWNDFNEEITSIVKSTGFRCALTAESGLNEAGWNAFALLRLGVEPSFSKKRFSELLAGVRKY